MVQSITSEFEYINRLKFGSTVRYTTYHAPEDILSENYFKNSGQYMEAGDEIDVVIRGDDGQWTKGLLEVVVKTADRIVVEVIREWRTSGGSVPRALKKQYIPGTGKFQVRDSGGAIVGKDLSKAEADALVEKAA